MYVPSKKIDEGNLKLGRFLGVKVLEQEGLICKDIYTEVDKVPFLRFDKSFDWLFVVICYLQGVGYHVNIDEGACMISSDADLEPGIWNMCRKDITVTELREVVFNSCVEAVDNYYDIDPESSLTITLKQLNEWNLEEEDVG